MGVAWALVSDLVSHWEALSSYKVSVPWFTLQNENLTAGGRNPWPPIREGCVEGDPAPTP